MITYIGMGETDVYWYDVMFIMVAGLTIRVEYLNPQIRRHVSRCNIIPEKKE